MIFCISKCNLFMRDSLSVFTSNFASNSSSHAILVKATLFYRGSNGYFRFASPAILL